MSLILKSIDLAIIKELLIDGRQSYAEIARKHNTTKETIRNHYKAMKKDGFIVGSTIRNSNLIYDGRIMVFFIVRTQPQKVELVNEEISKMPWVVATTPYVLKQRIVVFTHLETYDELSKIKLQLKVVPFVENVYAEILTAMRTMPYNLSIFEYDEEINKKETSESKYHEINEKISIDETDKQIIEKLAINGRTSFSKIAKEINKSTDAVIKRYNKLVNSNIIRVVVQINPVKLGYRAFALFSLSFSENELKRSIEYIKKIKNVNAIIQTTGKSDLRLILMIKDINEFLKEQHQIMKTPGIINADCDVAEIFDVWPPREIFFNSGAL